MLPPQAIGQHWPKAPWR